MVSAVSLPFAASARAPLASADAAWPDHLFSTGNAPRAMITAHTLIASLRPCGSLTSLAMIKNTRRQTARSIATAQRFPQNTVYEYTNATYGETESSALLMWKLSKK